MVLHMKCLLFEDPEFKFLVIIEPKPGFQQEWEWEDNALLRLHEIVIPEICQFLVVSKDKLPKDLTFRASWRLGDIHEPVKIDMISAERTHRERLIIAGLDKLQQLMKEWGKANEEQNLPLKVALKRTMEIVQTIHEMNLTHCKTIEDLKYAIPRELHDVWKFYDPAPSTRT